MWDLLAYTPGPPAAAGGQLPSAGVGTWADLTGSAAGDLPAARAGHTMVSAGDRLYSFGGYTDWPGERFRILHERIHTLSARRLKKVVFNLAGGTVSELIYGGCTA